MATNDSFECTDKIWVIYGAIVIVPHGLLLTDFLHVPAVESAAGRVAYKISFGYGRRNAITLFGYILAGAVSERENVGWILEG